MRKDELPADGEKVLFRSPFENPDRKKSNDTTCTILSREELPQNSEVYGYYTDHMTIKVQFPYAVDTQPEKDPEHKGVETLADLEELHLMPK